MTTNRFQSIGAILARVPEPTTPDAGEEAPATEAEPVPIAEPQPKTAGSRSKGRRNSSEPAGRPEPVERSASVAGGVRRIAFRLDPALHTALAARAAAEQSSQGQVVLDAIETAHEHGTLKALLHDQSGGGGGLFPRLTNRAAVQPTVPAEIRLDGRAVEVLDRLVAEVEAQSRTHLIVEALRAHLTETQD